MLALADLLKKTFSILTTMKKTFNIAGPCRPAEHYMLPTQERCGDLMELIEQKQYFVIHAAGQTGKTTLLLELTKQLNEASDYYALYCSLETVQDIVEAEKGIPAIVWELASEIAFNQTSSKYTFAENMKESEFNTFLRLSLSYFC